MHFNPNSLLFRFPAMQAPVCCQEPIIFVEGPWSEGKFCDINFPECPFRYLFLFQPNGTGFRAPFLCWVSLSTLLLPASTLLAAVLRVPMDCFGSLLRDGLSAGFFATAPPSSAASSPWELLQGFGEGKFVSSFLRITAVLYVALVTLEDVFIVPNCILVSVGFSAHTLLAPPDGFNFLGLARSNPGSFAPSTLCLYTQDPVARVVFVVCSFVSLSLVPRSLAQYLNLVGSVLIASHRSS